MREHSGVFRKKRVDFPNVREERERQRRLSGTVSRKSPVNENVAKLCELGARNCYEPLLTGARV